MIHDMTRNMTGGYHTNTAVTMYNLTGNFWELPELNTGRWSHGCGFYTREEQTVSTQMTTETTQTARQ